MKKNKFKSILLMSAFAASTFVACTNDNSADKTDNKPVSEEIGNSQDQDTIRITLSSDDRMKFDMDEINVYEGQTVILKLQHTGTMPVTAMGHNFVLLTQGTSLSDFATEALKANDNEYIPVNSKEVIAHTKLIGGGESDEITFMAPSKGTYDFVCSFPGHYAVMKGKFNVQ